MAFDLKLIESGWQEKIDSIFDPSNTTNPVGAPDGFREVCNQFKIQHKRYTRLWWNVQSLEQYLKHDLCPRGLRVQIFPAWEVTPEFKTTWEKTLGKCSALMMEQLMIHDKELLQDTKNTVADLHTKLLKFEDALVKPFLEQLREELSGFEKEILTNKKNKFDRDRRDRESNKMYRWSHRGNQRPRPQAPPPPQKSPQRGDQNQDRRFEGCLSDFLSSGSEPEEGPPPTQNKEMYLRTGRGGRRQATGGDRRNRKGR